MVKLRTAQKLTRTEVLAKYGPRALDRRRPKAMTKEEIARTPGLAAFLVRTKRPRSKGPAKK